MGRTEYRLRCRKYYHSPVTDTLYEAGPSPDGSGVRSAGRTSLSALSLDAASFENISSTTVVTVDGLHRKRRLFLPWPKPQPRAAYGHDTTRGIDS